MTAKADHDPDVVRDAGAPGAPLPEKRLAARAWRLFCHVMASVFYRRHEAGGLERLPASGPVILCANHVNALVDGVVIQSTCPRPIHPLARAGLFRSPLLRPLLAFLHAVPIHRRPPADPGGDGADDARGVAERNRESFRRCFDYLSQGRVLLIFPEGQSHSEPMLRPLKTGAARLALGHLERHGVAPAVVPVGLTFSNKGKFRSSVLVLYGAPKTFVPRAGETAEEAVRRYTAEIEEGLRQVTLNASSWEDLTLLRLLQGFFLLRRRRAQRLARRFRSLQRLIATHRWLAANHPRRVAALRKKLLRFEALCRRCGVRDYQLHLEYSPRLVGRFVIRSLAFAVFLFPLTVWGAANSGLPYFLTRTLTRRAARGRDQYDTAGMLLGLPIFLLFWTAQTFAVNYFFGTWNAAVYAASLPITAAVALQVGYERRRILENVRVFFLFLGRRDVRESLRRKRSELESELAQLARLAPAELERAEPAS